MPIAEHILSNIESTAKKNPASLENILCVIEFIMRKYETFSWFFFCVGLNLVEIDGVGVGFYLGACSQGKACSHDIRDVVFDLSKRVFSVFVYFHLYHCLLSVFYLILLGLFRAKARR